MLIATLHDLLGARGIAVDPTAESGACSTVHARIERRGESFVVGVEGPAGVPVERTVDELGTAATVIESWVRTDVGAPLLATHAIPHEPAAPIAIEKPTTIEKHNYDLDLFAAGEASFGNDKTQWLGAQVGACANLGPVCVAARLRFASVQEGPGHWGGSLKREGFELLIGIDVPVSLHFHQMTLTPGFGAGFGSTHTHMENTMHMGSESSGLRADGHVTLTIPVGLHLAIEVSATGDLTQETDIETSSILQLPDEPRALLRFGAGIRYGGI
jgi:hypothetical protein